ncbi:hypothetical protein [Prosthecomicrobium pneumaticum]|uniref:Uncharacterized protein n=1 Tax=Prosthecomicrobium pneumaticum TaxID=81895 RepID=A0A7W9FQ88_9HYPH|nr:hypothetical protein [Prosthecomicrobium pneumaticum]MBB5754829.1 hypothetical protein [Prosthecomicrobium pneumaticum]
MVRILTVSSSATATGESPGNVLVSGSYGGEYNAFHAAKWGIRGVVLNDAGIGFGGAGIKGLPYLDRIGLAGATADARTCHIADGEHMLEHGIISHVNEAARRLGCAVGQSVRDCAERMTKGPVVAEPPPEISGGKRFLLSGAPEPRVIALDAAPMLTPEDAGAIAITGSHAALFRGRPDNVIGPQLFAVFFNDAGVGLDGAGIARLPTLDERGMIAGTVSADSAPIGDARAAYEQGVLSHLNETARRHGGVVGEPLRAFVARLRGGGPT